jgi:hypothetical protein
MFRRLKADKDTMITNKVINGTRVTDANVGLAGTLDLFKLYNESSISGEDTVDEISRLLIHFDLDPLRSLTGSILDLSDSSFKATLKMVDVSQGHTVPSNYTVAVFPLSQAFDEGVGRDIRTFRDLDVANFITASVDAVWNGEGASVSGVLGSTGLDIIETGNIGAGTQNLFVTQRFATGDEDLEIDVTELLSATLVGLIPDHGFRIGFSGTQETDQKSRFVKRFRSRHANDPALQPIIDVVFDDSIQDDHLNFFFDLSGSLFLNNFHFGEPANIIFNGAEVSGADSLALRLVSGTVSSSTYFEQIITASQYSINNNFQTGVYVANLAIDTNATASLRREIDAAGSGTFTEIWQSLDGAQGFFTGSLVVKTVQRTAFDNSRARLNVNIKNNKGRYQTTEQARFRIYAQSPLARVRASKLPAEQKSLVFPNMYYQIRDANTKEIIVPFEETNNGTKVSIDNDGMYFNLYMEDLPAGRVYGIELKFTDTGVSSILDFEEIGAVFRVEV